jgi:hypothetical protein
MNRNRFGVLILTFGRADRVHTYETLRKQGYTGPIYLVCSSDDATVPEYRKRYGDQVIVFSKDTYRKTFDIGDNFAKDNVVVFARNAAFDIAQSVGLDYFLEVDDDYTNFFIRVPSDRKLEGVATRNLDRTFSHFVKFLQTTKVTSIALAQGGDYIGGKGSDFFSTKYVSRKRKIMNCFFNAVDRPYKFFGRINEDVNCYIQNGKTGMVFLTHPLVSANQMITQSNAGGLTEFYLDTGTYVKSFYTVMFNPSAVSISQMGRYNHRIHHSIAWKHAVPYIIRAHHKKQAEQPTNSRNDTKKA